MNMFMILLPLVIWLIILLNVSPYASCALVINLQSGQMPKKWPNLPPFSLHMYSFQSTWAMDRKLALGLVWIWFHRFNAANFWKSTTHIHCPANWRLILIPLASFFDVWRQCKEAETVHCNSNFVFITNLVNGSCYPALCGNVQLSIQLLLTTNCCHVFTLITYVNWHT